MMNHIVPEFEAEDNYLIPELPKKSIMGGDEDVMELLWQNGQVVMQSQNQRSLGNKKPETRPPMTSREIRSSVVDEEAGPSDLFMQEDEMASWLHYPVDDNTLESYLYNNDLLYPTPPSSSAPVTTVPSSLPPPPPPSILIPSSRPPIPPIRRVEVESGQPKQLNFLHFSRPNKGRTPESGPNSNTLPGALRPSTVVASNETPAAGEAPESRASRVSDKPTPVSAVNFGCGGSTSGVGAVGTSSAEREIETCELSVSSSQGTGGGGSASASASASGASASVEPSSQKPPPSITDDRKRKGRDTDDVECHSEDIEFEYADAKKQSHGSTSTKRSRAAEVHNLSERRRRDRINEKMKALQELIPRCNKSDKASMLDEAIEYLKSLQMQVQMMSMGCSMVPMMFPGVQQYMSPMAMGMGMGMGMDMGMNRVMVPYPAILPGSSLPNPAVAAATHLGPRFQVPGYNIQPVTTTCPATSQAASMSAPMMSSFPLHNQNQPRVPNFADPFQQYIGLHHTPLPLPQNQGGMAPIAAKPSSSKDPINPNHHQTG